MTSAMFITLAAAGLASGSPPAPDEVHYEHVTVFHDVPLRYEEDRPDGAVREGLMLRQEGRMAETVINLPPKPADHRDTQRITAIVEVVPALVQVDDGYQAGDPWPRLGSVSVLAPDADGNMIDVEIMRFITGFGGTTTFSEDLTALAPLLHDRTTLRIFINTYLSPAWQASLTLSYADAGVGFRRPALALPVFNEQEVTAEDNILRGTITVPEGLSRPRLRILSTGHATDGRGGDEFVTRTHILRIDGREVIRWRPWAEHGNGLRHLNPTSGRAEIDGRELWSSDFDRAGWHPGMLVQPMMVPAPELTPGTHEIELEVLNIRPPDPDDPDQEHGYWRVSTVLVADEPWPGRPGIRRGGREGD